MVVVVVVVNIIYNNGAQLVADTCYRNNRLGDLGQTVNIIIIMTLLTITITLTIILRTRGNASSWRQAVSRYSSNIIIVIVVAERSKCVLTSSHLTTFSPSNNGRGTSKGAIARDGGTDELNRRTQPKTRNIAQYVHAVKPVQTGRLTGNVDGGGCDDGDGDDDEDRSDGDDDDDNDRDDDDRDGDDRGDDDDDDRNDNDDDVSHVDPVIARPTNTAVARVFRIVLSARF